MKTCTVTVRVFLGDACSYEHSGPPTEVREWKGVDIMDTSRTRAWATRQFNMHWKWRKRDKPIRVEWDCRHDDGAYYFRGSLSGFNNIKSRRGYFED